MKLNYDCLRDVLLYLGSVPAYDENGKQKYMSFDFKNLPNSLLDNYLKEDIMYSLSQLYLSHMIDAQDIGTFDGPGYFFRTITPPGHEFLSNIRSPKIWLETKKTVLEKVGDASITIISNIASALTLKMLGL